MQYVVTPPPSADILFVIDPRATALPQYDEKMRELVQSLEYAGTMLAELHIGVVASADGQLQTGGCLPAGEHYLVSHGHPNGTIDTNSGGTLLDTVACLTRVGGEPLNEPAGAMRRALVGAPAFLGPGGLQTVVIATEDDTDPAVVATRAFLDTLKDHSYLLASSVIAPADSVGWAGLVSSWQDQFVAIEERYWSNALEMWGKVLDFRLVRCIEATIGVAAQCVVTDVAGATQTLLPFCPDGVGPRPCFWLELDPSACGVFPYGASVVHIERDDYVTVATRGSVRCPCDL
jgi:hypothetical protein